MGGGVKLGTEEQLEMVAKARRVTGYGGAFPPYEGLKGKILDARSFEEAFALRPPKCGKPIAIKLFEQRPQDPKD